MEIEISDMPTMDPQCSTSGVTEERESHFLGVYDKDDIGGAIKYVKGEKLFYDLYIVYAWSFDIYRYTDVNIFFNVSRWIGRGKIMK